VYSYAAALSGAVLVFAASRSFLRTPMIKLLARSGGLKKVVRAIEKRPKLLFLIRLSPYPYNVTLPVLSYPVPHILADSAVMNKGHERSTRLL
jgi:uncharacterized membrane protein YdjX (TVP38/TMEM64 family)